MARTKKTTSQPSSRERVSISAVKSGPAKKISPPTSSKKRSAPKKIGKDSEKKRVLSPLRKVVPKAPKSASGSDLPRTSLTAASPLAQIQQLPAPGVMAQRIHLARGQYVLRHLGLTPGVIAKGGLPFGTVHTITGDANITGGHTGGGISDLREANDVVVVNVISDGAEVVIACFNHPAAGGAGFRFMLSPLPSGDTAAAAAIQGKASTVRLSVPEAVQPRSPVLSALNEEKIPVVVSVGHSERLGDVAYNAGDWIGGVGNVSLRLEGFTLHMRNAPLGLALEYGVADAKGHISWSREGVIAGTRGQATPLYGVVARLLGSAADSWSISYECRFSGTAKAITGCDGEICLSKLATAHLAAVKFSIIRRKANLENDSVVAVEPENVRVLAHIEREGDRIFRLSEWIGTPGSGRAIEGLQALDGLLPGLDFAIGFVGQQPVLLREFFGSRGRGVALGPITVSLRGSQSGRYRVSAMYKFVGDPTTYRDPFNIQTYLPSKLRLEAVRMAIAPIS